MARAKGHKTFAENVRKMFLGYALVPLALLMVVFVVFFVLFSRWATVRKTQRAGDAAAATLATELMRFEDAVQTLAAAEEAVTQFNTPNHYSPLFELFYRINRSGTVNATMHLLEADGTWHTSSAPLSAEAKQYFDLFLFPRLARSQNVIGMAEQLRYEDMSKSAYLFAAPIESSGVLEGYLLLLLDEEALMSCIEVMDNEVAMVADRFGNVVLGTSRLLVNRFGKVDAAVLTNEGEAIVGGTRFALAQVELPVLSLTVYTANALTDVSALLQPLLIFMGLMAVAFTVLILFLSGRIAKRTSASVEQMIEAVNAAGDGKLDFRVDIQTDDEFQILGERFNEMQRQISTLIRHNQELTDLQWEAEVKGLESQFAPHFIFNVLETLRYSLEDKQVACSIIESLSQLLKYSVYSPGKNVTLKEEAGYITEFLKLHQLRSGGKIQFNIQLGSYENTLVPKLVLQPIVENSVKYGYNNKGRLQLDITARQEGESLRLRVEDNGGGAPEKALAPILQAIETGCPPEEHIGLFNLHRKLYLVYGSGYGLIITNRPGEGFTVEAILPLRWKEEEE